MKKKQYLLFCLFLIVLFFLTGTGIFVLRNVSGEKEESVQTEDEQREPGTLEEQIVFTELSYLKDVFSEKEMEEIQQNITNYIGRNPEYAGVSVIQCKDAVLEKTQTAELYFELDDSPGTVLYCMYDKETGTMQIFPEQIAPEVLNQEKAENGQSFVSASGQEGALPCEWDYIEELDMPVRMAGKEALSGSIPEEKLRELDAQLEGFLERENELRRELSISAGTINQTGSETEFYIAFQTPRVDEKSIHVRYGKETGEYIFQLEVTR